MVAIDSPPPGKNIDALTRSKQRASRGDNAVVVPPRQITVLQLASIA
jgi:hypothetical protein